MGRTSDERLPAHGRRQPHRPGHRRPARRPSASSGRVVLERLGGQVWPGPGGRRPADGRAAGNGSGRLPRRRCGRHHGHRRGLRHAAPRSRGPTYCPARTGRPAIWWSGPRPLPRTVSGSCCRCWP